MILRKKSRKAFSLIEVSIVIVIIGLLIVGVVGSKHLVKKARINSAQAVTRSSIINGTLNNKLWLESSLDELALGEGLSTGDALTSWADMSPNKMAIAISAVGSGPTYSNSINSVQAVKFDADSNSNYLQIDNAAFLNGTNYTIFITEKRTATNGVSGNYLLEASSSLAVGYESGSAIIQTHGESSSEDNQSSIEALSSYSNKPRVLTFTHSSVDGNKIYINATLANEDSTSNATTHLSGITTLAIGKNFNGEIGEIVIFDRKLKTIERESIEDYLSNKWNSPNNRDSSSSCTTGIILSGGCEASCTAPSSVNGITSSATIAEGASSTYACNGTGYTGNTPSYTCTSGALVSTPTAGDCVGTNGCADGYLDSGSNTCAQGCNTSAIVGSTIASAATGATSVACDELGYDTITFPACSVGDTVTGTCTCATEYSENGEVCEADCTLELADSSLPADVDDIGSGDVTYECSTYGEYTGTITFDVCDAGATLTTVSGTCTEALPPFISAWTTTGSSESITLPLESGGTYNFSVDWGDGSSDDTITTYNQTEVTHTYSTANTYTVTITGTIDGFRFANGGDKTKISNISQWGSLTLGNNGSYFQGASNLTITATDTLDLSNTYDMTSGFEACSALTEIPNITDWSTSHITNMHQMFVSSANFNQDLGSLDVSGVTSMTRMFQGAYGFDQDISDWNIANVTDFTQFLKNVTMSTTNYDAILIAWESKVNSSVGQLHMGNSKYTSPSTSADARTAINSIISGSILDGGSVPPLSCSSDTDSETTYGSDTLHTFTTTGSHTLTCSGSITAQILVVGGGGGGGRAGGGGGAGVVSESSVSLSATSYTLSVGSGGGHAVNGSVSTFDSYTAFGGGYGANGGGGSYGGVAGASSGGNSYDTTGTPTTAGSQGYAGGISDASSYGAPAGGGGAGGVGGNGGTYISGASGGDGGIGVTDTITGSSLYYGAGGGGGANITSGTIASGGNGGSGVGGQGSRTDLGNGFDASANTGSGGGGAESSQGTAGSGADGIVIIRYPTP